MLRSRRILCFCERPTELGLSVDVSIIIPALNEAEIIESAVRRAAALAPSEVHVVDGGSSDATAELARSAGANVITSARGRALQQNAGAAASRSGWLLFLHADCWLDERASEQLAAATARSESTHGAFRQRIDARGRVFRALERGNAARVRLLGLPYGDQGIFVRRELFWKLGGFPQVRLLEDLLLSRRLRGIRRPQLLEGPLYVSARRWQRHGVVRQTLRNWSILSAYACGVAPDRLAGWYALHSSHDGSSGVSRTQ